MANSYSVTETTTFTRAHAVHIAAKVAADLKRMQRFYGKPSDEWIQKFEAEAIALLRGGCLGKVTYGFRRDGSWIEPALSYTARDLADNAVDDDPGRVLPGAPIRGAFFHSYLICTAAWDKLTQAEQAAIYKPLSFRRTAGPEPGVSGYWSGDRTYSAGNCALDRSSLRSRR